MKARTTVRNNFGWGGTPGTIGLIAALITVFIVSWLMEGRLFHLLTFTTDWAKPWGIFTYPFADPGFGAGLLWLVFSLFWLYWVGGATEADLGTPKFLTLFFIISVLAAVFVSLGVAIVRPGSIADVSGTSLPIAALTVIWATRRPSQTVMIYGIIPVPAWLLGCLSVAGILFAYGSMLSSPLIGLFACLHLGLSYLFAANKLPVFAYSKGSSRSSRTQFQNLKKHERMDNRYFEDVRRREQDRAEKERLRKLFEKSMMDDPEK